MFYENIRKNVVRNLPNIFINISKDYNRYFIIYMKKFLKNIVVLPLFVVTLLTSFYVMQPQNAFLLPIQKFIKIVEMTIILL